MKFIPLFLAASLIAGCSTSKPVSPEVERGPKGSLAYYIQVDSSPQGAVIEADKDYVGKTPCSVRVWGDKDGTFHHYRTRYVELTASLPGAVPQTKRFQTGAAFSPKDTIPKHVFFEFGTTREPQ